MIKNKWGICAFIAVIAVIGGGIYMTMSSNSETSEVPFIRAVYARTGSYSDTCLFELSDDGILTVSYGLRGERIHANPYLEKIDQSMSVQLSQDEMQSIVPLVDEAILCEENDYYNGRFTNDQGEVQYTMDGDDFYFLIAGKQYGFSLLDAGQDANIPLINLFGQLLLFSPMKIYVYNTNDELTNALRTIKDFARQE